LKANSLKHLIVTIIATIFLTAPSFAASWNALDRIPYVGTMIAKKNSLPSAIKFEAVDNPGNNKYAITTNKIQINKSDIEFTSNDNELAYILSYELGKVIVKNINPNNKFCNDEDIDAMGIDLMINGGYNPLAGISVLEKEHKNNEAEYLYNYISYNYPSKILAGYNSDEYSAFLSHLEPLLRQIKANKRKLAKFNRQQAKINKARIKRLLKYDQNTSKLSSWGVTKDLIQSITEPEEK